MIAEPRESRWLGNGNYSSGDFAANVYFNVVELQANLTALQVNLQPGLSGVWTPLSGVGKKSACKRVLQRWAALCGPCLF